MDCCKNSRTWSPQGEGSSWSEEGGHCGRSHWKPAEIAAMVLGFVVFWPIGLAVLFAKMWQRRHGSEGDLIAFLRERADSFQQNFRPARAGAAFTGWSSTGNSAFDEWRKGELFRLEEERRKVADAERDFAEHIENLRRARDREEFESFMHARKGGAGA